MNRPRLFTLALLALALLGAQARAQSDERARAAAEIESLREQIKAREALLLAPSREDQATYADFLARPGTGLVRLLPREDWDHKLSTRGGGAYYSFTRLTHEYGSGTDLGLEQGRLHVGFAGADFGFLAELGDVPLEEVTAESEGVRRLAGFVTPSAEPEARAQQRRAGNGFEADGRAYRSSLPARAGRTYALRSVKYGVSDVLVVFRLVRRDDDGSVVLLWRMLKKYDKPELERAVAGS